MPTAVVAGGGFAGLAAALSLGAAGYRVRVLERCPPPPEGPLAKAAERWHRPAVPQAGHSHNLTGLGVKTLRTHAPQVLEAVLGAGASYIDLTRAMPTGIEDRAPRAGDEELRALACRRTTLELALYRAARDIPGVDIRHGATVRGLLLDRNERRATGVVAEGGERVRADTVIDATGRRGGARTWLTDLGVPVRDDLVRRSHLAVYTRFYRRTPGHVPGSLNRGIVAGGVWDHYAGYLHLGDDDTHSLVFTVLPGDGALRALRHPGPFHAAARATPWLAPWAEEAEPISPVRALTCPPNVLRGTATDLRGGIAGLYPVGDAACVTNPLFGRGMSLALAHAFGLGDLLADGSPEAPEFGRDAAHRTLELLLPWYEHSVRADAERESHWRAAAHGPAPEGAAAQLVPSGTAAADRDGTAWRDLARTILTLAPPPHGPDQPVWDVRAHAAEAGAPAPDHRTLIRLLAAAEGS